MNAPSNAVPDAGLPGAMPPVPPATRPMYWSVRRELWENRSVYIAPFVVAVVVLFGSLISLITLPHRMGGELALDTIGQYRSIAMPFHIIAGLVAVTTFIVGVFYCLDALHGERRDRSILFWKSLPVSDRTVVLAKAGIPLVVLPLIAFGLIVSAQTILLLLSTATLLGNTQDVAVLWTAFPAFQMPVALLYALTAMALWHAPVFAWLLMVSAWARRATFLWAVLPFLAITVFEGIAFRSWYFGLLLRRRLIGWFTEGFIARGDGAVPNGPLTYLSPGRLLSAPDLWVGLVFAAACLMVAVRLRRNREPI